LPRVSEKIEIRTAPAAVGSIVNCATASNDVVAGLGAVARRASSDLLDASKSIVGAVIDRAYRCFFMSFATYLFQDVNYIDDLFSEGKGRYLYGATAPKARE
jgi:hypothetical protein